jgi:hypothetical protein
MQLDLTISGPVWTRRACDAIFRRPCNPANLKSKRPVMSNDPERITILAREFTAAALEFHRGKMAEKGYRMEGSITPRVFKMIEGLDAPKDLFDGEPLFSVTFIKKD